MSSVGLKKMVPLDLIKEAQISLQSTPIMKTPLIALNLNVPNKKIYLKCENLQPFGSFKARGACFSISKLTKEQMTSGVCGASAGNFAQGLGYMAQQFGTTCTMLVPDTIPDTKLNRIIELGVIVKKVPFAQWWQAMLSHSFEGSGDATFIHPCDLNVIAGHGTMGLEIIEDLPDVDVIISPYGSGGLITGVASAIKPSHPNVKMIACEPEVSTPLKISLEKGQASIVDHYRPSFVDGMGGKEVLEIMWPYVNHLVDDSIVVTLQQIVDATRLLIDRNSLVAEGAGAATVAAAMLDSVPDGNIVCIISGGNIDFKKLNSICQGHVPDC